MFVVPSVLQVLLASVLLLLGVSGNVLIFCISHRTTLRCPHITMLAVLDSAAVLLGPGIMLVTIVVAPTWLEHNEPLCRSLSFIISSLFFTCSLVLLVLAVFCQKIRHNMHRDKRQRAKRREFVFLAVCCLSGLVLGVPPLLGWSSYNGLSFLHSCSQPKQPVSISYYSLYCLVCNFAVLSITVVLVFRAQIRGRLYPVQIFWERHELETKINDPELTTTASSNVSSCHSRTRGWSIVSRIQSRCQSRIQSRNQSRRTSFRSQAGTHLSLNTSPVMSRKYSQPPCALENSLLEIILRNARADNGTKENTAGAYLERSPSPINSERKDSQSSSPSIQLSLISSQAGNKRDPFVISSRIPHSLHTFLKTRKSFHNPRFLPQITAHLQQRSLSRLLSLRCCVTILCWLPLYATVVLQLSSVHFVYEWQMLSQWLISGVHTSISSLLPLCDASYRRSLRRLIRSGFSACTQRNKNHARLSESRGVEFEVEGTEQVRLKRLTTLGVERLNNFSE